jgi:hypothetical protein
MDRSLGVTRVVFGGGGVSVGIILGALGVLALPAPLIGIRGLHVVWIAGGGIIGASAR